MSGLTRPPSRCANWSAHRTIDNYTGSLSTPQPTDGLPDRRPARLSRLARVARPAAGGRLSRAGRGAGKSFSGRLPFLRKIFVPDWGSTSSGQQFSLKMDMVI